MRCTTGADEEMHACTQAAPKPRASRTTHEVCSLHGMPNTDTTSCVLRAYHYAGAQYRQTNETFADFRLYHLIAALGDDGDDQIQRYMLSPISAIAGAGCSRSLFLVPRHCVRWRGRPRAECAAACGSGEWFMPGECHAAYLDSVRLHARSWLGNRSSAKSGVQCCMPKVVA